MGVKVQSGERDKVRWDDIVYFGQDRRWMGGMRGLLFVYVFSTTNLAQKIGRPDPERTGQ